MEKIIDKIINYITFIVTEIIEYFRYCPTTIIIYSYNKEMDECVLNFLKKDINKVEIDKFNMFLISEEEVMQVWISNRWYAFGTDIFTGKIKEDTKIVTSTFKMLELKEINFNPTDSFSGRPSFKALRMLKYIYLKNGGER